MDQTSAFSEHIEENFARLTPAQQQMARYILDHKEQVAFRTAKQLAEDTGQSDAAVIRFAQAIGYGGYMALRESLRESLLQRVGESGIPEQSGIRNEQELKNSIFDTDAALVQQTAQRNADETVSDVANMIVGARRVYVSAHGTSYSLAVHLAMQLNHCIGKGEVFNMGNGDLADRFRAVGKDDVFIGIGYLRYLPYTIEIMRAAKNVGAQIVAITDRASSPLAEIADRTLLVARAISSPAWWSQAGTLTLTNWLLALILERDSANANAQLTASDEHLKQLGHWQSAGTDKDESSLSNRVKPKN